MSEKVQHTAEERHSIEAFAGHAGTGFRDDAIAAHRNLLSRVRSTRGRPPYGDLHFEFMREIDTPPPDYGLRAFRRKQLLDSLNKSPPQPQ